MRDFRRPEKSEESASRGLVGLNRPVIETLEARLLLDGGVAGPYAVELIGISLAQGPTASRTTGEPDDAPAGSLMAVVALESPAGESGEIHGMVWEDLDGDGVKGPGEGPLGGVTVYLDLSENGLLDPGEPATTTDATGQYAFTDLAPGVYTVAQIVPGHYEQTSGPSESASEPVLHYDPSTGVMRLVANGHYVSDLVIPGPEPEAVLIDIEVLLVNDRNETVVWSGGVYFGTSFQLYDAVSNGMSGWASVPVPNQQGTSGFGNVTTTLEPDGPRVALSAGQLVTGVSFGNAPEAGEIHGMAWEDLNGDGAQDADEPARGGVTIYLDLNDNGSRDSDEPETVTAGDGGYSFTALAPGTYSVTLITPDDYRQTFPGASVQTVSLTAGQAATDVTFGMQVRPAEIQGRVWEDLNGDGMKGFWWEGPLGGVTVYLDLDENGVLDPGEPVTTTDATGQYAFTDLAPGTYVVAQIVAENYEQTYGALVPVSASDPVFRYDPGTGVMTLVTGGLYITDIVVPGPTPETVLVPFGDLLENDLDQMVKWDGMANFAGKLQLYDTMDHGMSGEYALARYPAGLTADDFGDVQWGGYRPAYISGYGIVTTVFEPGPPVTSAVRVQLTAGEVRSVNFGNAPAPVEIHGGVWADLNGDGIHDADELPLEGVTVYLDMNTNGQQDPDEPSTTTDADGAYAFVDLVYGTYTVAQALPDGYAQTAPAPSSTQTVQLAPGESAMGVVLASRPAGAIRGDVWEDFNDDGMKNGSDGPLEGVTVYLDLNDNGLLDDGEPTTMTDASGVFRFTNLTPGAYTVVQLPGDLYAQTSPAAMTVDVASGQTISDTTTGAPVSFANHSLPGEIHGQVWQDADRDGVRDAGELPMEGVTVYLDLNDNGEKDADEPATTTDAGGAYAFVDLVHGTYGVMQVVPDDYTQIAPGESSSWAVELAPGQVITGVMFGNAIQLGEISGVVWEDMDGDGVRGDGEDSLVYVTVYLDMNGNGVLDDDEPETSTFTTGMFRFRDLTPGTYTVAQLLRDGYTQTSPGALSVEVKPGRITTTTATGGPLSFANHPLKSEIHGHVWHDANRDGVWDADEEPLEGVTIYLDLNGNGQQDADEPARATDANGQYSFVDLLRGSYRVIEVTPEGYLTTLAGGTAPRRVLTLAPDQKATDINFGNTKPGDLPPTDPPIWVDLWDLIWPGGWPDPLLTPNSGLVLAVNDDGTIRVGGDVIDPDDLVLDRGWGARVMQNALDVWDVSTLDTMLTAWTSLVAPGQAASLDIGHDAPVSNAIVGEAGALSIAGLVNVGLGGMLSIDGLLTAEAVNIIGGVLTNSPGSAAAVTIGADVVLGDGATFLADAIGAGIDTLVSDGTVAIGTDASLEIAVSGGGNLFQAGTYTVIDADDGLSGTFANVTDLGAYVSINGNGLVYDPAGGTVTLTLEMGLNPADGNFDGVTDFSDRAIWDNHSFTYDTAFSIGDYNNDGRIDVSDRIVWQNSNFTSAIAAVHTPAAMAAASLASPAAGRDPGVSDAGDENAPADADAAAAGSPSGDPGELVAGALWASAQWQSGWSSTPATRAGADDAATWGQAELELALGVDLGSLPNE